MEFVSILLVHMEEKLKCNMCPEVIEFMETAWLEVLSEWEVKKVYCGDCRRKEGLR